MLDVLALVGGLLASLVGFFLAGKQFGKAKAQVEDLERRVEEQAAEEAHREEVRDTRDEVKADVAGASNDDVVERLRDKWSRD